MSSLCCCRQRNVQEQRLRVIEIHRRAGGCGQEGANQIALASNDRGRQSQSARRHDAVLLRTSRLRPAKWQAEAKGDAGRDLPVRCASRDPSPHGDIPVDVPRRGLPDHTEQRRVIGGFALDTLSSHFGDDPEFRVDRQLADDAPYAERLGRAPIDASANVHVDGERR